MKNYSLSWAWKTFILSICLSILFSMLSQSLFPSLPVFLSLFIILFFIVISVIFDMIGVAVTSTDLENLEKHSSDKGFKTAKKLCLNTDKVSSFCGDVVGDICGILSGAGGVSLVVNLHILNPSVYFLITCLVSSLIAGLTIFGKAVFKRYAVDNCESVVLYIGKILENNIFSFKKFEKNKKNS